MHTGTTITTLSQLNEAPVGEATEHLLAVCHSRRWADRVVAGRPYRDADQLADTASSLLGELAWADIAEALSAHPRIGDRVSGSTSSAQWSRAEQSGVADESRAALIDANRRYEETFGHVFLIRASGRDSAQILAELERRLGNDVAAEREDVRGQLAEITAGRLRGEFA
ncbi:2-oxo-4-hydroxy-4-carboxy-5-ureidoimidazoline decarboxylase [Haloechinothrix alba]|uniref:2-oxo-4-hydroxy-4-carboxy-5-ureidoimidazoline decarboxylase n=1 Tax=Haloechinothrix alba TaxID=664784 RepID=A0A238Y184_9PSEU|nr:2-oxo-4-hydroxy-4-carboxy-5-ureidoimidazoline decarboxylase [Haloechinothrix alba]SNR64374.1 2-oxo-4-hydroxy-4-carboxy-5-ureidoimidazoline decarboxylase [Haloechinothrix alba]